MTIRIAKGATALGFQLLVKKIAIKHSRAHITLEAVPFLEHHAALHAHIKGHKPKIRLNGHLKHVLKKIDWHKSQLKPLKDLLKKTLLGGRKHPDRPLSLLDGILKASKKLQDFQVDFSPSDHQLNTPGSLALSLLPIQSLNFQIIPEQIRVKHGSRRIKIAAIVSEPGVSTKARYFATLSHGREKFVFSHELKHLISHIGWTKSDFHPLRKFLHNTLKVGHDTPDFIVGILATFEKGGLAPTFTLNKVSLP